MFDTKAISKEGIEIIRSSLTSIQCQWRSPLASTLAEVTMDNLTRFIRACCRSASLVVKIDAWAYWVLSFITSRYLTCMFSRDGAHHAFCLMITNFKCKYVSSRIWHWPCGTSNRLQSHTHTENYLTHTDLKCSFHLPISKDLFYNTEALFQSKTWRLFSF